MNKSIYVACGLTHVPFELFEDYMKFISDVGGILIEKGHVVRSALTIRNDPNTNIISDSNTCYSTYKRIIEKSDVVVAETSFPSTGIGIELQIAASNNIPIILLHNSKHFENKSKIHYGGGDNKKDMEFIIGKGGMSAMLEGLPSVSEIISYNSYSKAISHISKIVEVKYT